MSELEHTGEDLLTELVFEDGRPYGDLPDEELEQAFLSSMNPEQSALYLADREAGTKTVGMTDEQDAMLIEMGFRDLSGESDYWRNSDD